MAKDELIDKFKYIGTRPNRPDGLDKVTGRAKYGCLLYTSPSPRDAHESRMPSSA